VGHQGVREFLYAAAAVSPWDGQMRSLILPYMDASTMSVFLRYLREEFPREYCVIFLDGAGWHRARELRVPSAMKLVFMPPYSPELNPVEHVWEHVHENDFGNRVFGSLDQVEGALCNGLWRLQQQEKTVRSLCLFDWINTIPLMST
jgi:transposase